ncbi:site-specific integrase [Flagellimonas sp.]|uniref:site-specific integrase n=1 Tax=Flagellimonas sp. TaxID=2058762 RepID=UPI003BB154A7
MKNKKSFGIHFMIKPSKRRSDGKVPIYGRISVDGRRSEFSLNQFISEEEWCSRSRRIIRQYPVAKTLNPLLDKVATEVRETFDGFERKKEYVSPQLVKKRYLGLEEDVSTLKGVIKYHREEELSKLSSGTAKNYNATEVYLDNFLREKLKTDDIHLAQINYALIVQFENYLRTCKPLRSWQPLSNNGIMKHMERFQKIYGLAVKFDWVEKNPFKRYQLKFEEYDSDFLDLDELKVFENLMPSDPRLKVSKDLFIFSCYTGLSYVEVKQLLPKNIVIGIDGDEWIDVIRQKTKTSVKVPLLKKAKEIYSKYVEHPVTESTGLLFPTPANVTLNKDVKDLAAMAGIKKHLTFHVARHTFATTVTLLNGVPMETVSKLLGHTKLSTTKRYSRVIEQKISRDMDALKMVLGEGTGKHQKDELLSGSNTVENEPEKVKRVSHLRIVK